MFRKRRWTLRVEDEFWNCFHSRIFYKPWGCIMEIFCFEGVFEGTQRCLPLASSLKPNENCVEWRFVRSEN